MGLIDILRRIFLAIARDIGLLKKTQQASSQTMSNIMSVYREADERIRALERANSAQRDIVEVKSLKGVLLFKTKAEA